MHAPRTITLALATTAAVTAFAVLPISAAFASGGSGDVAASSDPAVSSSAPEASDDATEVGEDQDEAGDDQDEADTSALAGLHDVKIRALGSDDVRVSWRLEPGLTAPIGYSVVLRSGPRGRSALAATGTEGAGVAQHDFSSLDPDTLYTAVVTASYPDGTTAVRTSNAARTDRTAQRVAADRAADAATHAKHEAKQASKAAAKAAKKAAKLAAHDQRHADATARKATKRAADAARHAAKAADEAKHRADRAAKRAVHTDRVADAADAAESESEDD